MWLIYKAFLQLFFTETILLGASVFNIGYVCYLKGQFDGYMNLIMCVTLQIVIPTPVAAAIEMRHYAVIFSMFLMCHTWIILKCYDYDKYMMVSSNLLLDLLDIYLLNQGFLDAVWSDYVLQKGFWFAVWLSLAPQSSLYGCYCYWR